MSEKRRIEELKFKIQGESLIFRKYETGELLIAIAEDWDYGNIVGLKLNPKQKAKILKFLTPGK